MRILQYLPAQLSCAKTGRSKLTRHKLTQDRDKCCISVIIIIITSAKEVM